MENIRKNIVKYHPKEQKLNAITHYIGAGLALLGMIVLIVLADSVIDYVAFIIYGICLIAMFLNSAIYHSTSDIKLNYLMRAFDHCSIFLAIGGTYTPVLLIATTSWVRLISIIFIWLACLIGIVLKIISFVTGKVKKFNRIFLAVYIILGWISLILIPLVYSNTGLTTVMLLAIGGVFYSVGAIFYSKKSIKYNHAIWHLFILAASITQYFAVVYLAVKY